MAEISAKESPFTPGRPVQPEYFVARIKEIHRLERAIKQTISGRNENVFITGQRGIGKSSLARIIRFLAEKEYGLVGTHCFLGGIRSLEESMGVIFGRLLQDCTDKSLFEKLREMFREYIEGVTLFGTGIQFTRNKGKLTVLVDSFLPAMRNIHAEAKGSGRSGLVLIIDDLNGVSDVPQFSQFLKSFADTLATSGEPLPILLVLVGLPERREELIEHQPSIARIFDVVDLPTMSNSESEEFFEGMFSSQGITLDSDAMSLIVRLSGGLPMLMHEVGDAVFWEDKDNRVDRQDAVKGLEEAARTVGRKYIDEQVAGVLRNKIYSSILIRIGRKTPVGITFARSGLLSELEQKEGKNLDNFLRKTKNLGIIEEAETRGEYKFANPLYHLLVWLSDREHENRSR
jgi:energy-coupling factor transporter ATP-binding protein EcfA2